MISSDLYADTDAAGNDESVPYETDGAQLLPAVRGAMRERATLGLPGRVLPGTVEYAVHAGVEPAAPSDQTLLDGIRPATDVRRTRGCMDTVSIHTRFGNLRSGQVLAGAALEGIGGQLDDLAGTAHVTGVSATTTSGAVGATIKAATLYESVLIVAAGNDNTGIGAPGNTSGEVSRARRADAVADSEDVSQSDAGGDGHGDGHGPRIPSGEDPRQAVIRRAVGAYPRFTSQVDRLEGVYNSEDQDFENDDAFIARGGMSEARASATFQVIDPSDGRLCVVGFTQGDEQSRAVEAERREALIRGGSASELQQDRIEQLVAWNPATDRLIRGKMDGPLIAELTAEDKRAIETDDLRAAAATLREMVRELRIIPDINYQHNIKIDVRADNAVRFFDYICLNDTDRSELREQADEAQAFLGMLENLALPRQVDQLNRGAWLAGAGLYRRGLEVFDQYPLVQRSRGDILRRYDEASGADLPTPKDLPFFQEGFFIIESSEGEVPFEFPRDELERNFVRTEFSAIVDGIVRTRPASDTESEQGLYQADILARDGRRVTAWAREADEAQIRTRGVTIPHTDGTVTQYEFSLIPGLAYGRVVCEEYDASIGDIRAREIGMQELAGLIDYLNVDFSDFLGSSAGAYLRGPERDVYYAETRRGDLSPSIIAQERRDVRDAAPVSSPPPRIREGHFVLRLPHGCFIEFKPEPKFGDGSIVIEMISVPEHLRGHQTGDVPSTGQRLYQALRERCMAAGAQNIVGGTGNRDALISWLRAFREDTVTMYDVRENVIPTLEEAVALLETSNVWIVATLAGSDSRTFQPELLTEGDPYYEATPSEQISSEVITQELWDISLTSPTPGIPSDGGPNSRTLKSPHGARIEFDIAITRGARGTRVAEVKELFVPEHLQVRLADQRPLVSQRLMDAFRDQCRVEQVNDVRAVVVDPDMLIAFAQSFGSSSISLHDDRNNRLTSLDDAVSYLNRTAGEGHIVARATRRRGGRVRG